jgi:DNA recombination protein RmuC
MLFSYIIIGLLLLIILLIFLVRPKADTHSLELQQRIMELHNRIANIEANLKDDFRSNREEIASISKENRQELNHTLKEFKSELFFTLKTIQEQNQFALTRSLEGFEKTFDTNVQSFNELQRTKFKSLEEKQNELLKNTESRLETIRVTVEEKLEKTLSERLGQSFETVGKQLIEVQKGLGEMQTLAQDVGGLKRVLSNVKMRGGIGEVQLSMLLEQIRAPDQYESNVKTKSGSVEHVEFAIKLPGRDDGNSQVWLPIDAKFPKDVYEQLQHAYDTGEISQVEPAQRMLELAIKKMAKDINEKYIDPPGTTDFAIMFLPFEGIYAEVVRKASLLEDIQKNCKVIVTGPSTLAAILNSLQMGFRTLAIQKRSSEVWKVLASVKKEFETFGGLMQKAQKNIQTGLDQLDDVMGKRTKAIQRRLRDVETLSDEDPALFLPELNEDEND